MAIDTPKTNHSARIIPIAKQLLTVLKNYKKASISEYVISDNGKAVAVRSYLKRSAGKDFDFAEYTLGRMYFFGLGVEKDLPLAMEYLRSAAANGNEYAAELIRQKELFDKQSISLCISRLFKYLCGVLQEKAEAEFSAKIMRTDKKLRRRIAEKKQAQGLKLE